MNCGNEDVPIMLDSLQELFQEFGDNVTPTRLTERMEQKLRRRVNLYIVAYLYTSLGFVARRADNRVNSYYIIRDPELLAEKRAQFCKIVNASSHPNKLF